MAAETGTGIIVRVVFDEGSLTGKWTSEDAFPEGDFRRGYFEGDRLGRAVDRAAKVAAELAGSGFTLPEAAIAFALAHGSAGTVIPGMRNPRQAEAELRGERHAGLWPPRSSAGSTPTTGGAPSGTGASRGERQRRCFS